MLLLYKINEGFQENAGKSQLWIRSRGPDPLMTRRKIVIFNPNRKDPKVYLI